jgi:NAD(P)-dependent dehydrogenase (short-subunit alcohol dehydrogenase family)
MALAIHGKTLVRDAIGISRITLALAAAAMLASANVSADTSKAPAAKENKRMVALVTGSTSGLGREVAFRLAARGTHVIVHGRDSERGEAVVKEIEKQGGSARFYRADFARLAEVHHLAEAVQRDYDRLDLLVNNAGIALTDAPRQLSADGYELHFQVNYLSHFLLTDLLLPRIKKSAPARIVNVASGAQTPIDFNDPQIEKNYSGWRAYGQSKLAQITFTKTLAERLEGTGVTTYSLHPATYMDTNMVRRSGITPQSTVDEGADAVMQLVTKEGLENGAYFNGLRPAKAHAQAYDKEARERLWTLSRKLVLRTDG